mgnify:CR=1 FL=1
MKTKNILIVGVGGQGTLLTSRVIGDVAINKGYDKKCLKFMEWLKEAEVL